MITETSKPFLGLYVHVPFCHRRCPYCHFDFTVGREGRGRFAALVLQEAAQKGLSPPYNTVFFGGGTPLLANLAPLAAAWGDWLKQAREVTVEVNPENLVMLPHWPQTLAALGTTRVSVGVQSFSAGRLKQLGRGHLPGQAVAAVQALQQTGLSVGVDLLLCPFDGESAVWRANLNWLGKLRPHHVSVYMLEDPAHGHWFARHETERGHRSLPALYQRVQGALGELGYGQYEISNWALPGHESWHNRLYWGGGVWEGLGPSAASFDGIARRRNVAGFAAWQRALEQGQPVSAHEERLSAPRRLGEALVLALRTRQGACLGQLPALAAVEAAPLARLRRTLAELTRQGLLTCQDGRYHLPRDAYPMADDILCRLV